MTPAEWAEACRLWERGLATLEELEAKYGIRGDTLSKKFKKAGVEKGAKADEHAQEVADRVAEETADQAAAELIEHQKRVRDTRDTYYKLHDFLTKLQVKKIQDATRNGVPLDSIGAELKALKIASETLEINRRAKWEILGLDKEQIDSDDLPELVVEEISDEDAREMQAAKGVDFEMVDLDAMLKEQEDDVNDGGN